MAKSFEKIKAMSLRREGVSIKSIARILSVSKGSASLWCKDVKLSSEQIENLHKSMVIGGYKGRMLGAQLQKDRRMNKIEAYRSLGAMEMKNLSEREVLLLGLGLFLGEGTKGKNQFIFSNSNPEIIKLILLWLRKNFRVSSEDIFCRIFINVVHSSRIHEIQKRWAEITGLPLNNFKPPVFIKAKNKKIYENHNSHLGTLAVRVRKSSELHYRILGLCHGLVYKLI